MIKRILYFILFAYAIAGFANNTREEQIENKIKNAEYLSQYNPQEALKEIQDCLLEENMTAKNKCLALYVYANANLMVGNYDVCLVNLFKVIELNSENNALAAETNNDISMVYCRLKDFYKAFEYNEKATKYYIQNKDSLGIATCYNNKGIIFCYQEEHNTAETFFLKALNIYRQQNVQSGIATVYNNQCLYKGNTSQKIENIKKAILYNQKMERKWQLAENYNNMGRQFIFAHQYSTALDTLRKAKEIALSINAKDLICDNYEYSALAYSGQHQYKKTCEMLEKLYLLKTTIENDKGLRQIEQRLFDNKIKEQKEKMNFQKREMRALEENLTAQLIKRNYIIVFSCICIILIFVVFAFFWYKRKKRLEIAQANIQLEKSERKLAELEIQQRKQDLQNIQIELDSTRKEITSFAVFLRSQNKLLTKISELITEGYKLEGAQSKLHLKKINAFIRQYKNSNGENNEIILKIEQKNKDFINRLLAQHNNLTKGEKNLASLLRVGLATKDISMLTGASSKTINMNRYRLRKTLELEKGEDLVDYLQSI
jgi:DNA-binding NarL/FixJ family response regulator